MIFNVLNDLKRILFNQFNPYLKTLKAFLWCFFIFIGLLSLGYFISDAFLKSKDLERTVVVKGLSEKEVLADVVIMPIKITQTSNDLESLIQKIDLDTKEIIKNEHLFSCNNITIKITF